MLSYSFWRDSIAGKTYRLTWLKDLATGRLTCLEMKPV